jgi:hypothetical protein
MARHGLSPLAGTPEVEGPSPPVTRHKNDLLSNLASPLLTGHFNLSEARGGMFLSAVGHATGLGGALHRRLACRMTPSLT